MPCRVDLAAIALEFNRLQQAPLCCEARMLPDGDTLHDRMLQVAYEEGLATGVEGRAAGLLSSAIDVRALSSVGYCTLA